MWKHLKKYHNEEYGNSNSQSDPRNAIQPYTEGGLRQRFAKWVIKADLPFTLVDDDEFRQIVSYLRPTAHVISSSTLKRDITSLYSIQKGKVASLLQRCAGRISFAMDAWTSANYIPFLGITVHWVDENWKSRCLLMSLEPLSGPHSGENLSKVFVKACKEFSIFTKIHAITTDSASNNITFMQHLEEVCRNHRVDFKARNCHVRCLAHAMNLAVQDFLKELKSPPLENEDSYLEVGDEEQNLGIIAKLRYV
jgi:hypothetical protein